MVICKICVIFAILLQCASSSYGLPCFPRSYGESSFVCVCNRTYCDDISTTEPIPPKYYSVYTSSKYGARFNKSLSPFNQSSSLDGSMTIEIALEETFQTIIGFGGAFTDAAGINILSLSPDVQEHLLSAYFSPSGIEYTLGRVPIASTDFSTHEYSYDDFDGDLNLTHFALSFVDVMYKIPLILRAQKLSTRGLKLFCSPWSAPAWMKTNDKMTGRGFLIGEPGGAYYKSWAKYLVRFLDEYDAEGVQFWGMTAQNEPMDGRIPGFAFQSMGFTASSQRDFIAKDLGPALTAAGYGDVKLMVLDDDLLSLPEWAATIYGDAEATKYVSGLGVHWYLNWLLGYNPLNKTHAVDPEKFILATEACAGSMPWQKKVILGSWERAEQYANDITQDLRNWVVGWVDWNLALNTSGGPNWVNNNVDSPIIVNATADEFYKQPMFYAMGHFSKFLPPGSVRVGTTETAAGSLDSVAFLTPERTVVLIVSNRQEIDIPLTIRQGQNTINCLIVKRSINTFIWSSV